MRGLYFATAASLAAIILPAAPAEALDDRGSGFTISSGGPTSVGDVRFGRRDGDRRDRRRHRDGGDVFIGEWPQQGDTVWRADSYNDWWHDNPSRAFPRWVQSGKCERLWWSGGGWRC